MISLTNYDFQWARSELVIIYPARWITDVTGFLLQLRMSRRVHAILPLSFRQLFMQVMLHLVFLGMVGYAGYAGSESEVEYELPVIYPWNSGFIHETWWSSKAMLVYQGVTHISRLYGGPMWVKQCHFYHPWLGMVNIPPIYGEIGDGSSLFYQHYRFINQQQTQLLYGFW